MRIQGRVIIAITLITLIIITFGVSVGIVFQQKSVWKAQEDDLTTIAQLADYYISGEIIVVKLKGRGFTQTLSTTAPEDWPERLTAWKSRHPEFTNLAVLDSAGELTASSDGRVPPSDVIDTPYAELAFQGKSCLSSTIPTDNGMVFYLAVPIPDMPEQILVATLPGMYFADLLSEIVFWESGHIFVDDAEGTIIANIHREWVENRTNYIRMGETDPQYKEISDIVKRAQSGETGIGYFSTGGTPVLSSFRPVTDSAEGWFLGVIAPLPESPFRNSERALIIVGVISVFLGVIAAIIASFQIKRPFLQIEALKETAEAYSRAKSDFLANMSHEIRTPMNVVLGITESQLHAGNLPDSARDSFEKIHQAGNLLLHLINDILDLSKIEAGKMEISTVRYEIASLINDVIHLNMLRLDHKPVKFSLTIDENLPLELAGDELRIKQILNNILTNAFKYTQRGEVHLSFTLGDEVGEEDAVLIFTVSDTGRGMTPEQIEKLFDEYVRFDTEGNRRVTGTGLGMAITNRLVSLMGGEIVVDSVPGEGTAFTIRLPQKKSGDAVIGPELAANLQKFQMARSKPAYEPRVNYQPMPHGKILIVDDIPINIEVTKLLLESYQLNIDDAESGFETLEKVNSGNVYDIIFMDHMMPEMDGMETTKLLREGGYTAPIVALTANAVTGQAEIFMANGFDGFISKPIDVRRLHDILLQFIGGRER